MDIWRNFPSQKLDQCIVNESVKLGVKLFEKHKLVQIEYKDELSRIIHSQILNLKRSHAKVGHINFTVIFFVSCIYLMIFLKFR